MKAEDLDFAKIFESCSSLEFLTLNFFSTKFFAEEGYETPTRLPYDLAVKQFHLVEIKLVDSYMLANAICLIRSFPCLESLEIQAYGDAKDGHILESLELEHLSDVTFNHLKEVKLECFSSMMPEMQLIKLLLAKSPALVRLLIDTYYLDKAPLERRLEIFAKLVINDPTITNIIEIDAPMLRSFDFDGNITSIFLKNAPLLVKVSLKGYGMNAEDLDFAKVFESCPALEHLILDFTYAEFFAEEGYEAPTRLPFDLSVKRLYLYMLMRSSKLSYALCLIRSSPYLESLEIQACGRAKNDDRIVESLELEHFSDVTFNHLREVKLRCLSGTAPEMQLIKLLLAKSPELVRMLIDIQVDVPLEARLKIHAEVSNLLRASPEAEVVYEKIEWNMAISGWDVLISLF